jgi:N6-L-threonylcarbamoyladenine synthase
VHHLKSHIYANWLSNEVAPVFPLLALVVSGGHTQILYMPAHNQFEIIGTTHDDAVGECFDKVAKILGLPYPGGPSIAKAAENGDPHKYKFPHPRVEGLDFSFSGLKTAVLRTVQKELGLPISHPSHDLKNHLSEQQIADFAASFQKTAVDILVEKISMALGEHPDTQSVVVAGGVSANKALREALPEAYFPEPSLSGDNGAMVAAAAYYENQSGVNPTDPYKLNIYPRITIS